MDASVAALLGALIGAGAGVVGQIVTASFSSRNERRRIAVELGLREWERSTELVKERGGVLNPPALFVHYSTELMRLLDSPSGLTASGYKKLTRQNREIRDAIRESDAQAKADRQRE